MAVQEPQYMPQMQKVPSGDYMTPAKRTNGTGVQADDARICVVMVGLPARGKSYIAQKGTHEDPWLQPHEHILISSYSRPISPLALDSGANIQCRPISPSRNTHPFRRLLRHDELGRREAKESCRRSCGQ